MMSYKVSVVICAYNRANFLKKGLKSLVEQTEVKSDYEVIVVDNNSKDDTKKVCFEFIEKYPDFNLKYFLETQQGLSFARNKGIKEAKADIISYIDDDAIAREDYISNVIKAFKNNPDFGAIGGKVEPLYETGKEPLWMSKYLFGIVSKVDYGMEEKEFPKKFPTGCNMAFKKKILIDIGGFNTDLVYRGDEKYIFLKIKEKNIKILYAPDVFVHHFIEAFRVTPEHVDKVSRSVGASERLRLSSEPCYKKFYKIIEYLYKFIGSLFLFIMFVVKGKKIKGTYGIRVIFNTIIGFFNASEFAKL